MPESVRGGRSIPPVQRNEQGNRTPRVALLVPVKAFADAKQRLRGELDAQQRTALARWCAERVIAAAGAFAVHVVCDDPEVAAWAERLGVTVIRCDVAGLNPAVERGLQVLADTRFDLAIIAHGDLPLAEGFGELALDGTITVVPDYRYDGTNALVLPTALAGRFSPHYGSGSFRKHLVEALAHWPLVRVLRVEGLAHDLDTPADLADPRMEEVRQWLQTNPASPR